MAKINSNILSRVRTGALSAIALLTAATSPVQAGINDIYLYFDYTNSGYAPSDIWLSWQQGSAGAGQIYYGGNYSNTVSWSGGNLMSDPISLASVLNGSSGGFQTNGSAGGFWTTNAPSMNLYISYGGTANNNLFTNAFQSLATAPSMGSINNNIFAAQTVEISHVANNTYSAGDLTAINFLSVDLGLKTYATTATNASQIQQQSGFNTSLLNVLTNTSLPNYIGGLVNYNYGDIWNPAVAVDQNGRPIRVIPPNSLPTGDIGTWQSWSNYLQHLSPNGINNTTYLSNNTGLVYVNADGTQNTNAGANGYVWMKYDFTATVSTNNDLILTGSIAFQTNGAIGATPIHTISNLTITNLGANDNLQSWTIYNQVNSTNNPVNSGWNDVYTYMSNNGIVQGIGMVPTAQAISNAFILGQQNPMGDFTTALGVGLVGSSATNVQYPSQSVGDLSSYEWFWSANPPPNQLVKGLTNGGTYFANAQSSNIYYNGYIQSILNASSNTVYSIPYGDRIPGNEVLLSTVSNNGSAIGSWVIGLNAPLGGTNQVSWDYPTNILSGINHTTNALFYVGSNTANNLLVVRGGATNFISNAVGGISSVIGGETSSSNNLAVITGSGSLWTNAGNLVVGSNGAYNSLLISNGGFVGSEGMIIGAAPSSSNNLVTMNGSNSQIIVMAAGSSTALVTALDVRNGTLIQNAGQLTADALYVTNGANSSYQFNGGIAILNSINVSNGQNFQVGNGTSTANMRQIIAVTNSTPSNTVPITNSFANGLTVNSNASFQFSGVLLGDVTLSNGSSFGGNGTYGGSLAVSNGASIAGGIINAGTYSPGTLTIASNMTWGGGGQNQWFINSFTNSATNGSAQAGVQFNSIIAIGNLNITSDHVDPFEIYLSSLASSNNTLGVASFFDQTAFYSFNLVQAAGISNFNSDYFFINTNNFANAYSGHWYVGTNGNNLTINYTNSAPPPPAPSQTNVITTTVVSNSPYVIGNSTDNWGLFVTNGGFLTVTNAPGSTNSTILGNLATSGTNFAVVEGTGSIWSNAQTVIVGRSGSDNTMIVSNGGSFYANQLIVGANAGSSNNFVTMSGASSQMIITNAGGTGSFNVMRGTNTQNNGTLRTDSLVVTGSQAGFVLNGGTAIVGVANINNGQNFVVGDGATQVLFKQSLGSATNTFANGITINTNGHFSFAGTITNAINLNGGSMAGTGNYTGTLNVGNGSIIAPGNSPGNMDVGVLNWNSLGNYAWEINNFTGTASNNWDFITVAGALTINATSGSQFNINLITLDAFNAANPAPNWNNTIDQTWKILTAGSISGFASNKFNIDLSGFQNPLAGGSFHVSQVGNDIYLNFTHLAVVPEPSTYALMLFGAICTGVTLYRRRQQKAHANCAD